MIHPKYNRRIVSNARKRKCDDTVRTFRIVIPCWECHGMRSTDDGHCKVCWGKGTVIVEPNPMGMNPMMGPERN